MPQFIVVIYFEDLNAQEQARLEQTVVDFGLQPFLRWDVTGQRFALPPGTYRYEGDIAGDDLRVAIADAIEGFRKWQTVVVCETAEFYCHGLTPLDPPPPLPQD